MATVTGKFARTHFSNQGLRVIQVLGVPELVIGHDKRERDIFFGVSCATRTDSTTKALDLPVHNTVVRMSLVVGPKLVKLTLIALGVATEVNAEDHAVADTFRNGILVFIKLDAGLVAAFFVIGLQISFELVQEHRRCSLARTVPNICNIGSIGISLGLRVRELNRRHRKRAYGQKACKE